MKTIHSPQRVVLKGKASEVFDEINKLALWERYGISVKVCTISIICLN